ncbi:DUF6263 family protein [Polaribacter sp. Hel1_33_49]|uniref:DUF6263 family protein n=1 Tax=Polaribacter sp. Hel1_33_49 TaxID=1336803 RepID=UPI00052D03ED|nr:DUF6263 family protein [Polaribacter sp. Hel1_33_49]KGL61605.1 hypothetical protein PHEL49_2515 [Polaribacter sp. Hel1_33_49]
MKKLLFLCFLMLSINVNAQEAVLLRLNYEKGVTYDISMKSSQEMGTVMSMGMTLDMSVKILEVKDGIYESEMKFSKISMDMLQGGNIMSYDSSKSDAELDDTGKMMKAQMEPMLEAVIFAKGNDLGEVLETKVEPNIPGVSEMGKQTSTIIYPKGAVKIGTTWTSSKNEKGMVMDFVYKVKSILKDKVELDLSGKVSGMASGDITGHIDIDRKTGIPTNTLIDLTLSASGQKLLSKMTMTMSKN